jgi:ABC-type Mn2+/Zn2+ transport system ATPase subunit
VPFASDALVRLERVSVRLGRTTALSEVDLTIGPGDFLGVVGPSGAGKTTLIRTVLSLQCVTSGVVTSRRDLHVGYVPQIGSIDATFPLSVTECVLLAYAHRRSLPWATSAEKDEVRQVLERLGLADLGDRHLRELSGGQLQRVFIARALVGGPDLLVLDEPTSGIDVRTRHEMLHLLSDLHDGGPAIVLATHDLNGMAAHLPDLLCLNQRVVARGAPLDVLTPEILEATYGAPFEVLVHAGLPVVIDHGLGVPGHTHAVGQATRSMLR